MIVRNPTELGHLLKDQRQKRGLTQADLAALVGVSRKWVIDLEAGKRKSDLSLVLRTVNVLGLELDARERSKRREKFSTDIDAIIDASRGRR